MDLFQSTIESANATLELGTNADEDIIRTEIELITGYKEHNDKMCDGFKPILQMACQVVLRMLERDPVIDELIDKLNKQLADRLTLDTLRTESVTTTND